MADYKKRYMKPEDFDKVKALQKVGLKANQAAAALGHISRITVKRMYDVDSFEAYKEMSSRYSRAAKARDVTPTPSTDTPHDIPRVGDDLDTLTALVKLLEGVSNIEAKLDKVFK